MQRSYGSKNKNTVKIVFNFGTVSLTENFYLMMLKFPKLVLLQKTQHTKDVISIIEKLFPSNPGNSSDFYLLTTRLEKMPSPGLILFLRTVSFFGHENKLDSRWRNFCHKALHFGICLPYEDGKLLKRRMEWDMWRSFLVFLVSTWNRMLEDKRKKLRDIAVKFLGKMNSSEKR